MNNRQGLISLFRCNWVPAVKTLEPRKEHKEDKCPHHPDRNSINSEGPQVPSHHTRPRDAVLESRGKFIAVTAVLHHLEAPLQSLLNSHGPGLYQEKALLFFHNHICVPDTHMLQVMQIPKTRVMIHPKAYWREEYWWMQNSNIFTQSQGIGSIKILKFIKREGKEGEAAEPVIVCVLIIQA